MEDLNQYKDLQAPDAKTDNWFIGIIDHLKVDHFMLATNIATDEKKAFYHDIIHGETASLFQKTRDSSTQYFITAILKDFINELKETNRLPLKLAMGFSDSKLLVWSEIDDDDEETENALLIAEAKVNGKYIKNGFFINSTIIEKSDNLTIPPHYQTLIS
ncbi:hypothetical protein BH11BAC5_BH11BAC5_43100 [soil metagenome]